MRASAVVLVGVLALLPATARAENVEATALAHLDRGIAAYRIGDYDTAHRELALAQELVPDRPNPYRWLALTEAKQGNCKDALVHIESFLSRVPVGDARAAELIALRTQCVQAATTTQTHSAEPLPPPPPPPPPPFYSRWWFWTAVGAVAITSVGVAVIATRGSSEATLPAVHCEPTGCKP